MIIKVEYEAFVFSGKGNLIYYDWFSKFFWFSRLNNESKQALLWIEFGKLKSWFPGPWIVISITTTVIDIINLLSVWTHEDLKLLIIWKLIIRIQMNELHSTLLIPKDKGKYKYQPAYTSFINSIKIVKIWRKTILIHQNNKLNIWIKIPNEGRDTPKFNSFFPMIRQKINISSSVTLNLILWTEYKESSKKYHLYVKILGQCKCAQIISPIQKFVSFQDFKF